VHNLCNSTLVFYSFLNHNLFYLREWPADRIGRTRGSQSEQVG
jgi:hypothetical protein